MIRTTAVISKVKSAELFVRFTLLVTAFWLGTMVHQPEVPVMPTVNTEEMTELPEIVVHAHRDTVAELPEIVVHAHRKPSPGLPKIVDLTNSTEQVTELPEIIVHANRTEQVTELPEIVVHANRS